MPKLSEWIKTLGLDLEVVNPNDPDPGGVFFLENGMVAFLRVVPADKVQKIACFGYPESDCPGFRTSREVIVEEGDANSVFIKGRAINIEAEYYRNQDRNEERTQSECKSFLVSEMTGLRVIWQAT